MDSVLYFQRKNSGIHQLEITAVHVTSHALLYASTLMISPVPSPAVTPSLFPKYKSLYSLHLFSSYLFILPFTVVICFASLIPLMSDTTRSFSFLSDLFHLT